MGDIKDNVFIQSVENMNLDTEKDTILFYQREVYFLKEKISLKDKEIEARDRDIEMFKALTEENKKSRAMITDLYERKIQDLKRTIEILQGRNLS